MKKFNMKSTLMWLVLSLVISRFGSLADISSCTSLGGSDLQVYLRSHVNASQYRIMAARLQTNSKISSEQISVNLIQSEKVINNNKMLTFDVVTAVPTSTNKYEGYEYFPGFGRYKMYTFPITWPEAKKRCEDDGAHLIVMETAAETTVVISLFARKPSFPGASDANFVSIGVNDIDVEGHFVTVTGQDLNSLEYKTLHLYHGSDGRTENYLCADAKGEMHDMPNDWKQGYICEAY